jgi:hypothetical protein
MDRDYQGDFRRRVRQVGQDAEDVHRRECGECPLCGYDTNDKETSLMLWPGGKRTSGSGDSTALPTATKGHGRYSSYQPRHEHGQGPRSRMIQSIIVIRGVMTLHFPYLLSMARLLAVHTSAYLICWYARRTSKSSCPASHHKHTTTAYETANRKIYTDRMPR